ncbi:MAG TPA: DUF4019 domain-containing protein [Casimicrobiaceae bacterium]|jgi:hypothetical protein|nr:DUF4019 domain-containing protein [Casimicrobiaceae bacterium]
MKHRTLSRCRSALLGVLSLAALLVGTPAAADEESDRAAAVTAATAQAMQWLNALDAGRHAESWNDAAAVMKAGRNQQDWIREVANPREAFGKSVMRELQQAEFSTTVRGAPTGKYVTVIYLTQFVNAPPVYETILLTLEDNRWRIGGYSIDRAPEAAAPTPAPAEKKPGPGAGSKPGG